jgi:hypothetical protein
MEHELIRQGARDFTEEKRRRKESDQSGAASHSAAVKKT